MKAIIEKAGPRLARPLGRLLWFAALWLGGVLAVAATAYGLHWLLGL